LSVHAISFISLTDFFFVQETTMSSISGISSTSAYSGSVSSVKRQRPDPAQMAEQAFSKLDTKGQGYLEVSDLESAFSNIASASGSTSGSDATSTANDLFKKLDADSDGKVTKDEFSSGLKNWRMTWKASSTKAALPAWDRTEVHRLRHHPVRQRHQEVGQTPSARAAPRPAVPLQVRLVTRPQAKRMKLPIPIRMARSHKKKRKRIC
jgi:Ca2+-binding EF-hand superfamily protein